MPLAFLELAEKNPKDPVALDALMQVVELVNGTSNPAGGKDSPGTRAMTRLLRDHLKSDKLGLVCLRLYTPGEKAIDTALEKLIHDAEK